MNFTQSEISSLITEEIYRVFKVNEQRRMEASHPSEILRLEKIPPSFFTRIQEFAKSLTLQYEAGLYDCYERSFYTLSLHLETIMNLLEKALGVSITERVDMDMIKKLSLDTVLEEKIYKEHF